MTVVIFCSELYIGDCIIIDAESSIFNHLLSLVLIRNAADLFKIRRSSVDVSIVNYPCPRLTTQGAPDILRVGDEGFFSTRFQEP